MTSRHDPADQKDNDKEQWPVHCSARGAPGKNPAIIQSLERPFFVRLCEVFLLAFFTSWDGSPVTRSSWNEVSPIWNLDISFLVKRPAKLTFA